MGHRLTNGYPIAGKGSVEAGRVPERPSAHPGSRAVAVGGIVMGARPGARLRAAGSMRPGGTRHPAGAGRLVGRRLPSE